MQSLAFLFIIGSELWGSPASALRVAPLSGYPPYSGAAPLQSAPAAECPGVKVPDELHALGLQLFGSEEKLTAVAARLAAPRSATLLGDLQFKAMTAGCLDAAELGGNVGLVEKESAHDPYGLKKMNKSSDSVIVDIGANIGDTALMFTRLFPKAQIISFEPVPNTYFVMRLNLHYNGVRILREEDIGKKGMPGVLPLNMVVGDRDMNMTYNPLYSQLSYDDTSKAMFQDPGSLETSLVKHVVLQQFLEDRKAWPVNFFKIDCEGCEWFVLPQVESMLEDKKKTQFIMGQLHDIAAKDQKLRDKVHSILNTRDKKCMTTGFTSDSEFNC